MQRLIDLKVFSISFYWRIENSLLIACAEDDWKKAEYWWLFADEVYEKALSKAKRVNDTDYLKVLAVVREELDEV